jgi:hypothetical protein
VAGYFENLARKLSRNTEEAVAARVDEANAIRADEQAVCVECKEFEGEDVPATRELGGLPLCGECFKRLDNYEPTNEADLRQ